MNKRNYIVPILLSFSLLGCQAQSESTSNTQSNHFSSSSDSSISSSSQQSSSTLSSSQQSSSSSQQAQSGEKASDADFAFDFGSVTIQQSTSEKNGDNFYTPETFSFSYRDYRNTLDYDDPYTVGEQNILVIPVQFSDKNTRSVCRTMDGGCDAVKTDIEKTFFGDPSVTGWESVSSFYYKSSYGKLKLKGKVSDWFTLDKTVQQFESLSKQNTYGDATFYVLRQAIRWYQNTYHDLDQFDQDNDSFVDAVWLVYDHDFSYDSDLWWAYTYWDYENESSDLSAYTYAWASINYMYEGGYIKDGKPAVDAHTFIHESGHILGLDDYYTYDSDDNFGPCGGVDMMDYNIGDHNAYSKMLLGWTMPTIITGNTTLTIHPFESSGDCILIHDNTWNHTAMDEYLLIEFITPTGLNAKDAEAPYANGLQHFTQPGIKIYHIDSRLAEFEPNSRGDYYFVQYTDRLQPSQSNYLIDLAHSNTRSYSYDDNVLIHLLESNGRNTFKTGSTADDKTLFKEGSSFDPKNFLTSFNHFSNAKAIFNDLSPIEYTIHIDNISMEEATLTFTKN